MSDEYNLKKEAMDILGYYNVEYDDLDIVYDYIESLQNQINDLVNSYNKQLKQTNEENRQCMLLAIENQDLKEKLKELGWNE